MASQNEHIEHVREIRSIMERSSQFLSLSGLSGVFAGIVALFGALVVYLYQYDFYFGRYYHGGVFLQEDLLTGEALRNFYVFTLLTGAIVLVVAHGFVVYFTNRNARRKRLPRWNTTVRRMLINLIIPLAAGGMFCLALLYHGLFYLVAPVTLIFYGLALVNASKYTLRDIRYLGLLEIALGLAASIWVGYGLIVWAIGFGLLHIGYGLAMYLKYEGPDKQAQ